MGLLQIMGAVNSSPEIMILVINVQGLSSVESRCFMLSHVGYKIQLKGALASVPACPNY